MFIHSVNIPLTIFKDRESDLSSKNFWGTETSSMFASERKEDKTSGSKPTETAQTATRSVTEPTRRKLCNKIRTIDC